MWAQGEQILHSQVLLPSGGGQGRVLTLSPVPGESPWPWGSISGSVPGPARPWEPSVLQEGCSLCPSQPRARRDLSWALPQSSQGDVCWGASD